MPGSAANPAFPTNKGAGREVIATSGQGQALGTGEKASEVTILALSTNTDNVYVMPDGTAGTDYTATGFPLAPGKSITLPVKTDLSEIIVDTDTNNNEVAYIWIQTEAR